MKTKVMHRITFRASDLVNRKSDLHLTQFLQKRVRSPPTFSCIKGEVRVQNNLSSNERLYNAHLPHKVLNLHVKSNSRNKAINCENLYISQPP